MVLYAGVDDLIWGKTSDEVLIEFQHFVGHIHAALPETWIYFILGYELMTSKIKPMLVKRFLNNAAH